MIGTVGTNKAENRAFFHLDRHFLEKGLNVPEIIAVTDDGMAYLQTDLGDVSLFRMLQKDRLDNDSLRGLLRETINRLPDIQFRGAEGLDFSYCYPVATTDSRSIMWDLNYFKYCFVKLSGIEFDEVGLENDFERLTSMLLEVDGPTFMYRDFQSRNVMVHNGVPWFIDFQGGRRGPCLYDLASFLWQARAGFSDELRHELSMVYLDSVRRYRTFDTEEFHCHLKLFALFRTMQVLGAYGLRGLHEQKQHFLESIPAAIVNLAELSDGLDQEFPALTDIISTVKALPQYAVHSKSDSLVVEVNSFGFKMSGIPADFTGNGGGYVFDCRAIANPGHYPEYMHLTGLDSKVIDFIEADGGVYEFLGHAKELVTGSVKKYIERGFTHLKVSFGCTGGRHRSVYCAQAMADYLNSELGVAVELHHREQHIDRYFPPR